MDEPRDEASAGTLWTTTETKATNARRGHNPNMVITRRKTLPDESLLTVPHAEPKHLHSDKLVDGGMSESEQERIRVMCPSLLKTPPPHKQNSNTFLLHLVCLLNRGRRFM